MTMMDHSQAMDGHVQSLDQHHAALGQSVTDLYDALDQLNALVQLITQMYTNLQGTHSAMSQTIDGAKTAAANISQGAANTNQ